MSDLKNTELGGGATQAMALIGRGRAVLAAMPAAKRRRLILLVMALAASCALVAWWGSRTEWKTLYSGMEARDVQQVEGELATAGVEYQSTPDGLGIQVPSELLDKARMDVAAKGMPQSGRMGFELFDKPNWVGSEFDEKVNYQRALEGELEHTIGTIAAVQSARVHLVLSKDSLFSSEQQAAKASVVLKLKRSLRPEEVDSVRNLVAGAVEGLTADQVTLVDADGRTNLNTPGRSELASDEEHALEQKLVAMLEPLAGRENVRATVNLSYDQGSVETTNETVDPSQVVALTTQKSDQVAGSTVARAAGIPGTVSNTPGPAVPGTAVAASQAAAKESLPVYPGTTQPNGQMTHEESSTFAATRHLTHEEQGPGRLVRISAAVLINDRAIPGAMQDGKSTVWRPRTTEEMKRLEELAQAAVGLDAKRGDQVVLQNIAFAGNMPEPKVTAMEKASDQAQSLLRAQPELLRTMGAGLMAVMLVLFVVRPVAKQAMVMMQVEPRALGSTASLGYALAAPPQEAIGLSEHRGVERLEADASGEALRHSALDHQGVLEQVGTHIRTAPMQSTRLLEAWINERGERF